MSHQLILVKHDAVACLLHCIPVAAPFASGRALVRDEDSRGTGNFRRIYLATILTASTATTTTTRTTEDIRTNDTATDTFRD